MSQLATAATLVSIGLARRGVGLATEPGTNQNAAQLSAVVNLSWKWGNVVMDYVYERIDGRQARDRICSSVLAVGGGMALQHGAVAVARTMGQSLGPVGQFAASALGNMAGQYLAEKFITWVNWLFQADPRQGFLNACQELGVNAQDDRKVVKRAFARCHPDKGSGLSNEEFEMKHVAFELIRLTRIREGTWYSEDSD